MLEQLANPGSSNSPAAGKQTLKSVGARANQTCVFFRNGFRQFCIELWRIFQQYAGHLDEELLVAAKARKRSLIIKHPVSRNGFDCHFVLVNLRPNDLSSILFSLHETSEIDYLQAPY